MAPLEIPGVELGAELGRGASGVVYAGTLASSGHPVAVKIVAPRGPRSTREIERALQEAELCWALNHPHIVRVLNWGVLPEGAAYLVMEQLKGETLGARRRREGQLSASDLVPIAVHLARGLAAIHAREALHRDMKPDNVFLCTNGAGPVYAKILDLGIAQMLDGGGRRIKTADGIVLGTPGYISPEQAQGLTLDGRSDLYGLGATLFKCLSGQAPHQGGDAMAVVRRTALAHAPPEVPDDVPAGFASLLRDLLQPDRDRRIPDATTLLERLSAIDDRPSTRISCTAAMMDGATVRLADLHLPTFGTYDTHQRFRTNVVGAVGTLFPPGHVPPVIGELLGRAEATRAAQATARDLATEARRQADSLARALAAEERQLDDHLESVCAHLAKARKGYLRDTLQTLVLADRIGDIDRAYSNAYATIEALQREAAERASAEGAELTLEALYGERTAAQLATLRRAHGLRDGAMKKQRAARNALRRQQLAIADLVVQVVDLQRAKLAIQTRRQTRLAEAEDTAREHEDERAHLDRSVEQAFVELGVALQTELAER